MATNGDLTLYHLVPSRSCRVLWLIKELGLPVDIKQLNFLQDPAVLHTEEFKKVNPLCKLPALVQGDACVTESVAGLLFLLEQHGNGKLEPPKSDAKARAAFLNYMVMSETELTAGLADYFWHTHQFPEDQRKPQIAERGKASALAAYDALEKTLSDGREYLINNEFSAADIAVGYGSNFLNMVGLDDEKRFPNVRKYTERITSRPAFKDIFGK